MREWLSREESARPTASLEGIFITGVIDAKEDRDIMSADIPNAFIQATLPNAKDAKETKKRRTNKHYKGNNKIPKTEATPKEDESE